MQEKLSVIVLNSSARIENGESVCFNASIAIKWFVPEIHSDAARRLLASDHTFLVPDFFLPEVVNIF